MRGLVYKYLFIIGLVILCFNTYSQILFEDACSLNSISEQEKEEIKNNGYFIRTQKFYTKDFASKKERKNGVSKIEKYIECNLKIIHNGVDYQIFVIGDVIRYRFDGLIEREEIYDSTGFPLNETEYIKSPLSYYQWRKDSYQHLIKGDTLFIKGNYIYYSQNGNIQNEGYYIKIYTKDKKNGIWTYRKALTGSWIAYKENGEIKVEHLDKKNRYSYLFE